MIVLTIIVVVLTILLLKYVRQFLKYRSVFNKLPGIDDFHILYGNLHKFPGPNEEGLMYEFEHSQKFRYFHRTWVGPFVPVIIAYHPDTVKAILKSTAPKPRSDLLATPYDMGLRWLGEGLLIANGSRWARSRRLLTPAFHFDILKPYVDIYNQCATVLIGRIKELAGKNEPFDLFSVIEMSALDVILLCAFSYQSDCQTKGKNQYTSALEELVKLWTKRSLSPHLFNETIYGLTRAGRRFYKLCDLLLLSFTNLNLQICSFNKIYGFLQFWQSTIEFDIQENGERQKVASRKAKDFLDTLLMARDENGVGLSPLEIRNEVDTFLFEGHDTTSSGMTWTLYNLARHPEYQERVYEEVISVLGDRDKVEWDDLSQLPFTTMCIKENLRLHPAVPFIERKLDEDLNLAGYTIPSGTLAAVHIGMLHHNPHVWDNPNEFVPERFHPDKQVEMDPFQFIPFSASSRNCIGQNFAMNEMKVTVAQVIKNFRLTLDPKHEVRRFQTVTLRAETGVMVYAVPRDKN